MSWFISIAESSSIPEKFCKDADHVQVIGCVGRFPDRVPGQHGIADIDRLHSQSGRYHRTNGRSAGHLDCCFKKRYTASQEQR